MIPSASAGAGALSRRSSAPLSATAFSRGRAGEEPHAQPLSHKADKKQFRQLVGPSL